MVGGSERVRNWLEEQMFIVARDGSGSPVKARGVVIIAAAATPPARLPSLTSSGPSFTFHGQDSVIQLSSDKTFILFLLANIWKSKWKPRCLRLAH